MEEIEARVILKSGREKPLRNGHPWIFSGAIARLEGEPTAGAMVDVCMANGHVIAQGYYNEKSQIQVRIVSLEDGGWRGLLERAIARRKHINFGEGTDAFRLISAESDQIPGLVVDQYGDTLVMQCLTAGIDRRKEEIADLLMELVRPKTIIDRSDAKVRRKEGLTLFRALLRGEEPAAEHIITENGLTFAVDLMGGHKTGFYLDQRINRSILGDPHHVAGKDVLNVFSYTGGFGVYAARGGAKRVVNVDSSVEILEMAEANFHRNGYTGEEHEFIAANAFEYLRHLRDEGERFDVVVLDPPKFVNSQRDLKKASRGYKDIAMLGMQLLRPNGVLATFSCSGLMPLDLYQKIVFSAAVDAKREASLVQFLTQAPDHTISLMFPESFYLKGMLVRVGE